MGIIKKLLGKKGAECDVVDNNVQNDDNKRDIDIDLIVQKEFVHLESAYRNQEYVFLRATEENRLCLGELLEQLLKTNKSSVISMAVAYRLVGLGDTIDECVIDNPEVIWNYDLFSCILKNTYEGHYTKGMFHETTLIVKTKERNCFLVLTSLGGPDTVKYMRVSVLSPDNSKDDDGTSLNTNNAPLITSFILSYSETINNPIFDVFSSVEDSVNTKQQNGQDYTELEREYIHGQFEFRGYYYVGYGKWLFEQERYYDTYTILERAFNYLKSRLDELDEQHMAIFYDICNTIGVCLLKLGREDEACFYFRQGASGLSLNEANWLALSYAKLGNPIAMKRMSDWLMLVSQKYGDQNNWPEAVKNFSVEVPSELTSYKEKKDAELESNPIYTEGITIGYILLTLWGLNKKNLAPIMFVYDIINSSFLKRIENADEIFNYLLNTEASSNKVFVLSCSHAHYRMNDDEEDKSILCHNAPIVISTHSIKGQECSSSIRIDMLRHNFSNNDDNRDFVRQNVPLNVTFTIGLPCGITYSQEKESLLAGIEKGISFVQEKRFIEAYKLSKWVFECVSNSIKDKTGVKFESEDEMLWNIFYESSFVVGYCLMELGEMHTAAYYLEIASFSLQSKHVQEYINCLANSQDPLALDVVEDVINRSPKPESEEDIEIWNDHMVFLKRRKAYILIDLKRYNEARLLLVEMLDDPSCEDFARGELEYLDAIVC